MPLYWRHIFTILSAVAISYWIQWYCTLEWDIRMFLMTIWASFKWLCDQLHTRNLTFHLLQYTCITFNFQFEGLRRYSTSLHCLWGISLATLLINQGMNMPLMCSVGRCGIFHPSIQYWKNTPVSAISRYPDTQLITQATILSLIVIYAAIALHGTFTIKNVIVHNALSTWGLHMYMPYAE